MAYTTVDNLYGSRVCRVADATYKDATNTFSRSSLTADIPAYVNGQMQCIELAGPVFLLGSTGTGKTTIIKEACKSITKKVVTKKVGNHDSRIVLMIKDDFRSLIRPKDVVLGENAFWNYFRELPPDFSEQDMISSQIAEFSFKGKENQHQKIFTTAPKAIYKALILHIKKTFRNPDNYSILHWLYNADLAAWRDLCNNSVNRNELLSYLGNLNLNSSIAQGVLAELNAAVTASLTGQFAIEGGDFSFRSLLQNGGGVFIKYDLRFGGANDDMYGLMFNLINTQIMSGIPGKVYEFIDEVSVLGNALGDNMSRMLNFSRTQGLGAAYVGAQSIAQLNTLYGEKGTEEFLAAFMNKIFLRCNDNASVQYIEDSLGKYKALQRRYIPGHSLTIEEKEVSLVEDTELQKMEDLLGIVKLQARNPFNADFHTLLPRK